MKVAPDVSVVMGDTVNGAVVVTLKLVTVDGIDVGAVAVMVLLTEVTVLTVKFVSK